jgi:hypothetical protein
MKDCVESTAQWLSTHCARRRSLQDDIRGTTEEEIKDAQASDLEVLVLSLPYPGFLPWRILDHLDEFTWLRKVRWSLHISSDAAEFCRSGRGCLISGRVARLSSAARYFQHPSLLSMSL